MYLREIVAVFLGLGSEGDSISGSAGITLAPHSFSLAELKSCRQGCPIITVLLVEPDNVNVKRLCWEF